MRGVGSLFRLSMVLVFLFAVVGFGISMAGKELPKVLFDNAHAQTAGNADWTIYGGYSEFADVVKSLGFKVESHEKADGPITYELLKNYVAFVIPEPNRRFRDDEVKAILKYIKNGGGVFFIGDHAGADRDHDGWDAVKIFNVFVPELGFYFAKKTVSQAPNRGPIVNCPITKGVKAVGGWGATWIEITDPKIAKAAIYFKFNKKGEKPYVVYGTYGKGRFVAIGDSSPFDDGKGAPGNHLHDNWDDFDHPQLAKNVILWLAGQKNAVDTVKEVREMIGE